ncbi:Hemicentin-1 [Holothuria leucospilota]|uniref:Hemicentin-1 n=1 Tax=Holothuria leucospilota TaxID=206669 RepID=A0A9Q1HEM6_HOLLE|nr:Hemicentin-1 [Holothuria leucospilota]
MLSFSKGICQRTFQNTYLSEYVIYDEANEDRTERTVTMGCQFGTHFPDETPTKPGFAFPRKVYHCVDGNWNDTSAPDCQIRYAWYLYTFYELEFRNEVIWQGDQLRVDFFTKSKSLIANGPFVYKANGDVLENSTLTSYFYKPAGGHNYRAEWRGYPKVEDTGYYYYRDREKYFDKTAMKWKFNNRFEYFYLEINGPIDGEWSEWSSWSSCTATCGDSTRTRSRPCDNPAPQYGGKFCDGLGNETESCTVDPCPVNGNWAPWSTWSTCTDTCGGGSQTHTRTCTNPAPAWGGMTCAGDDEETTGCNSNPCPINGGWGAWDDWSTCTVSCGGQGTHQRTRLCDDPPPQYGGIYCPGDNYETGECGTQDCKQDGNWAQWTSWSPCSVTCGFGTSSRNRTCSDPAPASGGRDCPGSLIVNNFYQEEDCMELLECPVDGGWTEWSAWTNCSELCGGGYEMRNRSCTNPAPSSTGQDCEGNSTNLKICNAQPCGVDGQWGLWTPWSYPCSVTCGDGVVLRSRGCDNPPPTYGGEDCIGVSEQVKACNEQPCLDGGWTEWSPWSICSASCLGGVQARSRSCTNPRPGPTGLDCPSKDPISQWQRCNQQPCPVHGRWAQWSNWTQCSMTCGGGLRWRARNCSSPSPQWGGNECKGKGQRRTRCNTHLCPVFAVSEKIEFVASDTSINATWSQPLDYIWPILYYKVHIRPKLDRKDSERTILYNKADGFHYHIYNLSSFKTYSTKDNSTFSLVLPFLQPYSSYEVCISTKYNYTQDSLHSEVMTINTLKYGAYQMET